MRQLLEVLLHYAQHSNHNVVTSALDALLQLLRAPPTELLAALVAEGGVQTGRLPPTGQQLLSRPASQSLSWGRDHSRYVRLWCILVVVYVAIGV